MCQQWPAAGSGALAEVLGGAVCWHKSSWRRSPLARPQGLKDSRTRPSQANLLGGSAALTISRKLIEGMRRGQ